MPKCWLGYNENRFLSSVFESVVTALAEMIEAIVVVMSAL